MMSLEVLHFPLDDIASMVRNREISPVTLMKFVIERVKTIHAQLNVIVEDRFEEALAEAKILEDKIAAGASLPHPLLGLPFSVKANISIKGMRLDMGSWSMHGQRATETATAITRLQNAGAIPICTTNISELGLWHDTVNPIYGRTLNPWHRSRIVGGSSGGEAALIAAGGTLFGVASDFDGSLRIPSAFCGTYAHKPSRGIVPLTGQFPFFKPEEEIPWRALDSLGPVTRSAKDLALILDILAGPCSLDPMSMTGTLSTKSSDIYKKKIGIIESPSLHGTLRTSPEVKLGIHKCRQRLLEAGAEVVDAPRDLFFDGFMLWRLLVHRAFEGKLTKLLGIPTQRQSFFEIFKWFAGQADHSFAGCLLMLSDQKMIQPDRLRTLDSDLGKVRRRFEMVFSKLDALVVPVYPEIAPRHQLSFMRPMNLGLTGLVNCLGLPATSVPVGISSSGMPVGAQVIGREGEDFMTISTADVIGEYIPSPLARGEKIARLGPGD